MFVRSSWVHRGRWSAVGAAMAVALGAGGLMTASATVDSGSRPVMISITPCRLMDTRPGADNVGSRVGALGANDTHTISARGAAGHCSIPSDAIGLVLNLAAIAGSANSFLTVFPADATRPLAANLNWSAGEDALSNAATVRTSADGRISFYNLAGSVHVAADVIAYLVDHTHDDRYFTESELNEMLAQKASLPVSGNEILDNSVGTIDVTNESLTGTDVADESLTGADIADGELGGVDIADNSLTAFDTNAFYALVMPAAFGGPAISSNANPTLARATDGAPGGEWIIDWGFSLLDRGCGWTASLTPIPPVAAGGPPGMVDVSGVIASGFSRLRVRTWLYDSNSQDFTQQDASFTVHLLC